MKHIERADERIEANDYPGTIILEPRKYNVCITPSKKKTNKQTNQITNNQTNQGANEKRQT